MSRLAADGRVIAVLWRRDLVLFARQKSRIAGTLIQPILFWLAIGSGMAPTFRLGSGGIGYLGYFFPGTLVMLVLFSSIFATMSVIEDRHQGFLQGVLVSPGSRASIVLGKALASTTVALVQAALFVLLAPLAGFALGSVAWGSLFVALGLTALALAGLGFTIAWWLDSTQGYHVVMSLVLFPAWILSGAMFPPEGLPAAMRGILRFNPMSYSVSALRRALHGGALPPGTGLPGVGPASEFLVVAGLAVITVATAAWYCSRAPAAA